MDQDKVAGKILMELIGLGVVDEKDDELVYAYLEWAYAVGYDAGTKLRSNKREVAQFTLTGELVEMFESAAEAARKTGVQHSDICRTASGKANEKGWKSHTAGGFKWKYVNNKYGIQNSSDSVGTSNQR